MKSAIIHGYAVVDIKAIVRIVDLQCGLMACIAAPTAALLFVTLAQTIVFRDVVGVKGVHDVSLKENGWIVSIK